MYTYLTIAGSDDPILFDGLDGATYFPGSMDDNSSSTFEADLFGCTDNESTVCVATENSEV